MIFCLSQMFEFFLRLQFIFHFIFGQIVGFLLSFSQRITVFSFIEEGASSILSFDRHSVRAKLQSSWQKW